MVVNVSGRLGWKRARRKSANKLGIIKDQASTETYGATSMLTAYDLSLTTNEHVSKNYAETAIDASLFRRTQMLQ